MRRGAFFILILVGASSSIEAACIDPATFVSSTVSITRDFDEEERRSNPGVVGIRGTGWFLSPRLIVTAAHVVDAMHLSADSWKAIEIRERESKWSISTRIIRVAGLQAEKLAVLELEIAIPNAAALPIRLEPLVPDEPVVGLAYPKNKLRFAEGRFVEFEVNAKVAGAALMEMYDGGDRLVLDHGASGAPILDCDGRVVAVVSTAITQTLSFASPAIRTSTAWQTPNVVSITIETLRDLSRPD